ncbi:hypothetical protein DY000_02029197 [Brassica cretica]|uniref:Uncharacterized protein n=1 Tax=Brassica cretica TaxID=69181 RepID=A0ABQ7DNU0_BRACR|nr:hypothetical protein DY000_02029197 [Brassica cretica]
MLTLHHNTMNHSTVKLSTQRTTSLDHIWVRVGIRNAKWAIQQSPENLKSFVEHGALCVTRQEGVPDVDIRLDVDVVLGDESR